MSGCRALGLRKLHPPCRTATTQVVGRESWQRTETLPPVARHDALEAEDATGVVETTDPQGARANRRHIPLQEARVARIAECHTRQKMGYTQHINHIEILLVKVPILCYLVVFSFVDDGLIFFNFNNIIF